MGGPAPICHSLRLALGGFVVYSMEPDIGPAFVQLEPSALDRVLDPCAELRAAALQRVEEERIDSLDVDPAVLNGFDAGGELDELVRCGFRVGEGTIGGELHEPALARFVLGKMLIMIDPLPPLRIALHLLQALADDPRLQLFRSRSVDVRHLERLLPQQEDVCSGMFHLTYA